MATNHSTAPKGYVSIGQYRSDPIIAETFTPNDIERLIAVGDLPGTEINGRRYVRANAPMPDPHGLTGLPHQLLPWPQNLEDLHTGEPSMACPKETKWGNWAKRHYPALRRRAKKKNLEFRLTCERLVRMVESTGGECEVTGIPFSEEKPEGAFRRPWVPSVDRIDCSEGYTPSNCRIVCAAVNQAMGEHGEEVLFKIARALKER